MRLTFLLATLVTVYVTLPVAAQRTGSLNSTATNSSLKVPIALASRPNADDPAGGPQRLACAPLLGQVFDPNGQPLVGATLLVKGTHQVYVTDSDGKFQLTDAVYQNQVLTIGAAGYTPRDIVLDDCTLPRLVLEKDPDARIKRTGKRAGQVIRLKNRNTTLK